MEAEKFVPNMFGQITRRTSDRWSFDYFQPNPMPRELDLSRPTVFALSKADSALGRLSGVGRLLHDPSILVQPYLAREALASSRIEGTVASLSDVLQAEAGGDDAPGDDVMEVINYQRALYRGMDLLDELPLSVRFIKELHQVLLTGVRGQEKLPGELRDLPVWIGSTTDSPDTAVFVPPMPGMINDLLTDWEKFLHEEPQMPVLVRCALMHYQFETIHPFLDGNGRIGRLLITMMLLEQKVLPLPLLYVSAYMEARRREYYERLQAVREEGKIQEWLQYFFTAVENQALDAESRSERLVDLRERYRHDLLGTKSRAIEVVELLFNNPFITVRRVELSLNITNQGARNLVESIERRGWIQRLPPRGQGGRVSWVATDIYDAIS